MMGNSMKNQILLIAQVVVFVSMTRFVLSGEYSGGHGSPDDPYKISSVEDLMELRETPSDYGMCFQLRSNINLDGSNFMDAVIAPDTNPDYHFAGTAFSGTFDGHEFIISNVHVTAANFAGFFGCIDSNAVIKNLGLEQVDITLTNVSYAGGLAGYVRGFSMISNCYVKGGEVRMTDSEVADGLLGGLVGMSEEWTVIADSYVSSLCVSSTVEKTQYVGGLVGYAHLNTITDCHTDGSVYGYWYCGGIAGCTRGGLIEKCYSKADVTSVAPFNDSFYAYAAGLVGVTDDTRINECYAQGRTESALCAAGLVGDFNLGTVYNSYAVGAVEDGIYAGGFCAVCRTNTSIYESNFWDEETAGVTRSGGTPVAASTKQMLSSSYYEEQANWDFTNTWYMDGYPALLDNYRAYDIDFDEWAETYSLSGENANPLADPANDGIPNMVKYAMGLNPTCDYENTILVEQMVNYTDQPPTLSITYNKAKNTEAQIIPERVDSLIGSEWTASGVVMQQVADQPTYETWMATLPMTNKVGYLNLEIRVER